MTFVAEVNGHDTNGRKRAGGAAAATQQLVAQHTQRSLDRVRALDLGRSHEQARAGVAARSRAARARSWPHQHACLGHFTACCTACTA